MSEPFLGEIQLFAFNYAPEGWMPCQGQTLDIRQYAALYAILGTMYGGNGTTTFMLPDLRGRAALEWGPATAATSAYKQGATAGAETVTLTTTTIPAHTHLVTAYNETAKSGSAANNYFAQPVISPTATPPTAVNAYALPTAGNTVGLNAGAVSSFGGGKAHDNMQPYLTLNYCIAVRGIFPPRN